MKLLFSLYLVLVATSAYAEPDFCQKEALGLPPDVGYFLESWCYCQHFSGEEPYDEDRREFLKTNIEKYCHRMDETYDRLRAKYVSDVTVMKKLESIREEVKGPSAAVDQPLDRLNKKSKINESSRPL